MNAMSKWAHEAISLQPVRPIVLLQSDDWGRVGMPDIDLIDQLQARGLLVGDSSWDYYGAESEDDLTNLSETLGSVRDCDGRPACMTANIVMANADLQRMRAEGFREFHAKPILEGFPTPWPQWDIVGAYHKLIARGVIYPALHGYTHFSPTVMLSACRDNGDLGRRARALVELNIPYLASLTPEFNFALLLRKSGREEFSPLATQRDWVQQGVELFSQSFGVAPTSTCAPGYRANLVTQRLWVERGIKVVQTATKGSANRKDEILEIPRNVFFEPAFFAVPSDCVAAALHEAEKAVAQGKMIVICTHSINYIEQHLNRRDTSLQALSLLLRELLLRWPNLRFAHDGDVHKNYNCSTGWFSRSNISLALRRIM